MSGGKYGPAVVKVFYREAFRGSSNLPKAVGACSAHEERIFGIWSAREEHRRYLHRYRRGCGILYAGSVIIVSGGNGYTPVLRAIGERLESRICSG